MAGRKPFDREQLSQRALAVAGAIIAERGLAAVTAREVAADSGVSVGSLYNLFESLDDLIFAINRQTLDQLHAHMAVAAGEAGPPVERMAALARAYIDFAEARRPLWRAVFEHQPAAGRVKPASYFAQIERIAALALGIMRPLFGPEERVAARRTATMLWAGVHGICALAQGGNLATVTREDPRDLAELLVRSCLAGSPRAAPGNTTATNL